MTRTRYIVWRKREDQPTIIVYDYAPHPRHAEEATAKEIVSRAWVESAIDRAIRNIFSQWEQQQEDPHP